MTPSTPSGQRGPGWQAFGLSDPGRQRGNNEDVIHCGTDGVFLVADGVGGEAAGEVAAKTAAEVICRRLAEKTGTVEQRLREAIWAANQEILRLADREPNWRGMACVLTVAVLEDGDVHVGHVGDTRLYEIRNGDIRKITRDHSPVGVREDAGELDERAAMSHPRRNEVFRDVGSTQRHPDDDEFIELHRIPFAPDSILVLCSDGLTDLVTAETIRTTVQRHAENPEAAVRELIALANDEGGKDNVSVIVVRGERVASPRDEPRLVLPAAVVHEQRGLTKVAPSRVTTNIRGRLPVVLGFLAGLALGIWGLLAAHSWMSTTQKAFIDNAEVATTTEMLRVAPGASIGAAVAKAKPGDVITVADGVYDGPLTLRDGVSIVAAKAGAVVIRIESPLPAGEVAAINVDGLRSARLEGLVIQAAPAANVSVGVSVTKSRLDLVKVTVTGMLHAGLWIGHDSTVLVAGSEISDNREIGIQITETSRAWLFGNEIRGNGRGALHGVGVWVGKGSKAELGGNVISDNEVGVRSPQAAWLRGLKERNRLSQRSGTEIQTETE